jgi:hypothetical protein
MLLTIESASTGQLVSKGASSARQGLDHLIGEIEELQREWIHSRRSWSKGIGSGRGSAEGAFCSRAVRGDVVGRQGPCLTVDFASNHGPATATWSHASSRARDDALEGRARSQSRL